MELVCLTVAAVAAVFAWGLTPPIRAAARRLKFVDQPGGRKIHTRPVAYGGGVAVALAMAAGVALTAWGWRALLHEPGWAAWRDWLGVADLTRPEQTAEDAALLKNLAFCFGGAFGALLLGLADDRWAFSPAAKLAGQFVLAVAVVAGGVRITALIGDNLPMQTLTVLWLVLITNSFNLLDNMDGLCAGTAGLAAAVLAFVALTAGQAPVALALAALAGAALGFLRYNRAPASIFLGDAGSMFLGFLMASLSVVTTYYHYHESALKIGAPFLVLAIPLYDTASVLLIRFRQKRPILRGDTSHFSHRLVDLGMTPRQAVATIHLAALAIGLPAALIGQLSAAGGLLLIGQALLILTLIALLERAGAQRRRTGKSGGDG